MKAQISRETTIYKDGKEKMNLLIYYIDCPDCGHPKTKYSRRQLYTNGIIHDGYSITIDCPKCHYHEYQFIGPDI